MNEGIVGMINNVEIDKCDLRDNKGAKVKIMWDGRRGNRLCNKIKMNMGV